MTMTPTSYHAFNLFNLTMATQFGANWRREMAPEVVAAHADDIALGFGGLMQGPAPPQCDGAAPTLWRFPDGSIARASRFGLDMEEDGEASPTPMPVQAAG